MSLGDADKRQLSYARIAQQLVVAEGDVRAAVPLDQVGFLAVGRATCDEDGVEVEVIDGSSRGWTWDLTITSANSAKRTPSLRVKVPRCERSLGTVDRRCTSYDERVGLVLSRKREHQ